MPWITMANRLPSGKHRAAAKAANRSTRAANLAMKIWRADTGKPASAM
jgi:hypothetical protein